MFENMMKNEIVIIDYGIGNIKSVEQAFSEVGARTIVSSDLKIIRNASKIVLPGVGAFENAMNAICDLNLSETIVKLANNGVPLLGICLGMQLLFDASDEFGVTKGLGLIPGRVQSYPLAKANTEEIRVPQINWHELIPSSNITNWENTLLSNLNYDDAVYFVHSYVANPANKSHRIAEYKCGGNLINAVVVKDNITGCQFHPEKSGLPGLNILRNFINQ